MIDWDKTVIKFLDSVIEFLNGRLKSAMDTDEYARILENIKRVEQMKQNPAVYCDCKYRLDHGLNVTDAGFVRGENYNMIREYHSVIWQINELYKARAKGCSQEKEKEELLNRLKKWYYYKSTGFFKDFVFPFKDPKSFAAIVSAKKQHQK